MEAVENGVGKLSLEDSAKVADGAPPEADAMNPPAGDGGEEVVKKKKKKKAKEAAEEQVAAAEQGEVLQDLSLKIRKKKKKARNQEDVVEDPEDAPAGDSTDKAAGKYPWSGSTRDYEYTELLGRIYDTLTKNNPTLGGHYRKNVINPPDIQREGVKKSVFNNFQKICQQLKRDPNHFMQYFLAELSTTGNFDSEGKLIIRGRFNSTHGANVLKNYIREYAMCKHCKSIDTLLDRDQEKRMTFLRCQRCGAFRTVSAIKAGVSVKVSKSQK